jgi:hypothetical protein
MREAYMRLTCRYCEPLSHALSLNTSGDNAINVDEGTIELLTKVLGEAGPATLDKAVSCAMPLAEIIDWIVEFGWTDRGQEAGL